MLPRTKFFEPTNNQFVIIELDIYSTMYLVKNKILLFDILFYSQVKYTCVTNIENLVNSYFI